MAMDTFFGECTYPPLVEIRENPKFHDLKRMDEGGLGVFFGMGGFLGSLGLMVLPPGLALRRCC